MRKACFSAMAATYPVSHLKLSSLYLKLILEKHMRVHFVTSSIGEHCLFILLHMF